MKEPWDDEKPAHQVTLTNDYYIGKYEVTQALWKAVMGYNPSAFKGDNLPVEQVSWDDCQEFISKLNSITGKTFRLPTEELDKKFQADATESNLTSLGGHRSVGGERASIYNAMPREGVVALRDFMIDFMKKNA